MSVYLIQGKPKLFINMQNQLWVYNLLAYFISLYPKPKSLKYMCVDDLHIAINSWMEYDETNKKIPSNFNFKIKTLLRSFMFIFICLKIN